MKRKGAAASVEGRLGRAQANWGNNHLTSDCRQVLREQLAVGCLQHLEVVFDGDHIKLQHVVVIPVQKKQVFVVAVYVNED